MRRDEIAALDLTRYGKFTDRAIDFGEKPASGPDFHIVFGLNEAGKSTALSAYLDLLFGIEERSRYNFLHDYSSMRIGGLLEFEGQAFAVSRTKSRSNSLHDAEGRPLSEIAISAHLAGLSRDGPGVAASRSSRLTLPAVVVGTLRTMVERRSGITTSLRMARDEAAAALDGLNAARGRVGEERAVPEPARAKLMAAVSEAKASGHICRYNCLSA
ncbi:AAA family ATPase [Mesorhizobium sp. M00.F.Ca.ET.217.01.1.1]|uniref:AAA family ATPase n=1 Tax=Mesorhizobium sp. M00.F.Ca.ET.217.01.1.1 TaxID=2500529 RepID=UPI001FE2411C|nr:AAA family ATPase [Mesorhizobium sp. M00.F.Ca.ET.217.01.1.1]